MHLFKITYGTLKDPRDQFVIARSFLDAQELFSKAFTEQIIGIFIIDCIVPKELIESDQD